MVTVSVGLLPWLLCLYGCYHGYCVCTVVTTYHGYCVCKGVTMGTVFVEVLPWLLCL